MRAAGYRVRLEFLWVADLAVSRERVRQRVTKGGHDIPDDVQQRRFHLGLANLAGIYRPVLDQWRLLEVTGAFPRLVLESHDGTSVVSRPDLLAVIERVAHVRLMPEPGEGRVEDPMAFSPEENTRRALRALRKAYADAVLENLRYGLPVIQWRDGRVIEVPAEDLAPRARRILAANGEPLPEDGL